MSIQLKKSFSAQQKIRKFNAAVKRATLKGKAAAQNPLCARYQKELNSSPFAGIQY